MGSDQTGILLSRFQDISGTSKVLATDDLSGTPRSLVPLVVGFQIFIQKAQLSVTTDNAATQTLQDDAGTPVVVAKSKASPGLVALNWDFGPDGVALTADKGLKIANSAAGLAGMWTWTGYMRRTPNTAYVP